MPYTVSPRLFYVLAPRPVLAAHFVAHNQGMNLQLFPKILTDAYAMFDSLELSVTSLVVAGLVLTLVFLFAIREAATWFFKINDIKSDVRKLRQLVIDMEGEVRMLNGLLAQNVKLANAGAAPSEIRLTAPDLQTPPSIKFPVTH